MRLAMWMWKRRLMRGLYRGYMALFCSTVVGYMALLCSTVVVSVVVSVVLLGEGPPALFTLGRKLVREHLHPHHERRNGEEAAEGDDEFEHEWEVLEEHERR